MIKLPKTNKLQKYSKTTSITTGWLNKSQGRIVGKLSPYVGRNYLGKDITRNVREIFTSGSSN